MKKCGVIIGLSAVFAALCAMWPAFAAAAAEYVSVPAARALARISALAPVSAVLVLLAAAAVAIKPRVLMALSLSLALLVVNWAPVAATAHDEITEASEEKLAALCLRLTRELNARGRDVPAPKEALAVARKAMNAPAAPRAALLPRLMRKFGLAGIYIPITGEAVVDITRYPAGLTFTAAHELAHMLGAGGETQANIAAYEACAAYGGAAAYSARLWALRYAIARLGGDWRYASGLNAEIYNDLARIPYATTAADYAALADYLAAQ
jgi:hypothetical protein